MESERDPSRPGEARTRPDGAVRVRVLLVANYFGDSLESMQRFAVAMERGLQARGVTVRLIRPEAVLGRFCQSSRAGLGKWLGYLDKFVLFPSRLRREVRAWSAAEGGSVVIHVCDHSNAIYTRQLRDVAHVVTCHDMLAIRSALGEIPENPTRLLGRIFQRLILKGLKTARHIACVSRATEKDVCRVAGVPRDRVAVVANALNYDYAPLPRDEAAESARRSCAREGRSGPGESFVLHVGGNPWYKNRMGVLRIYAHLVATWDHAPALVLVGEPLTDEMTAFIAEAKLEARVFALLGCDNEALRALYSAAGVLLFPSLAEGFGWPVIEAQACGCPVVCSDREPLLAVAGPGAEFVPPKDVAAGAARVRAVLGDADLRSRMIEQGLANAARHRPEVMIAAYLDTYAAVARHPAEAAAERTSPRELPIPA